jgi:transposase
MERVYTCCAGLDLHKQTVVACHLHPEGGAGRKEIRTFGTTVALEEPRDWVVTAGCAHVAMEATGVYWKPIYHVLEGHCALLVVNAGHMRAVPGRKTDVRDAKWMADLLQHGLLRPGFIPSRQQRHRAT